jgi:peptidoglycan-N-acetylglucosamine deacetylase
MPLPASISLDLDNEWAYLKTRGGSAWESSAGYLPRAVPRILDLLRSLGLKITFFIVGRDATDPRNAEVLRRIADEGHEIANHSWLHEPWLHLYTREQLHEEFRRTEEALHALTGQMPRGFRGPGFSTSPLVRDVLAERGYVYDGSQFPTVMGPVARAIFFLTSKLPPEEKAKRKGLYGSFRSAFGSLRPYQWENGLTEIPVTTMPLTRLPIHLTYLVFLAKFSLPLATLYWKTALTVCRMRGIAPSILLHPTDFIDVQDAPALDFFPGMKLQAEKKLALVRRVLSDVQRHWQPVTMLEHATAAAKTARSIPSTFQSGLEAPTTL